MLIKAPFFLTNQYLSVGDFYNTFLDTSPIA